MYFSNIYYNYYRKISKKKRIKNFEWKLTTKMCELRYFMIINSSPAYTSCTYLHSDNFLYDVLAEQSSPSKGRPL